MRSNPRCCRKLKLAAVGILTLTAVVLTAAANEASAARQPPASIREAARGFVAAAVGANATIEVTAVDERLQLPECSTQLAVAAHGTLRDGQGTVAVSCAGTQPWRLFVPVRTVWPIDVVVTRRDVRAGETLTAADVALERRVSAALPYQYLTAVADAAGLVVRRSLPARTVLVSGVLERPELVARGALVALVSGSGSVAVRVEGVALEGGGLNQRVRVRSPSGRVVEGIVAANGEVRVGN